MNKPEEIRNMDNSPEIPSNDFASNIEGLNTVSGPAAFKAQQKANVETSPEEPLDSSTEQIAQLSSEILALEATIAQGQEQMLRLAADMENLRKRSVREREDASKYAVSSFARDILDVADTFGRALQSIPTELRSDPNIAPLVTGIEATERSLLSCFEKYGIKRLEPMDEPFNPHFHEVMFEAAIPGKAGGLIIQLIEPGYILHDRLLRPARVGVSKADASEGTLHSVDTQA